MAYNNGLAIYAFYRWKIVAFFISSGESKMMKKSKKIEKFENSQKSSEIIVLDHKSIIMMKIDKKSHFNVVYMPNIWSKQFQKNDKFLVDKNVILLYESPGR